MPTISRRVRLAVRDQLADGAIGFNRKLTAALEDYGVDPHQIQWSGIDWLGNSTNFLFGRISPDFIDQVAGALDYPILTIDSVAARHTNEVVSATFAGSVQAVIDFHMGWLASDTLQDFSSYSDAVEDAMFTVINNLDKQNYGAGMLYNGRMSHTRGPIVPGGPNWRQTLTFMPEFKVITL